MYLRLIYIAAIVLCSLAGCDNSSLFKRSPASTQPSTQPATQPTTQPLVVNVRCPVLDTAIDPTSPTLNKSTYKGKTYGFCCPNCLEEFEKAPQKFADSQ